MYNLIQFLPRFLLNFHLLFAFLSFYTFNIIIFTSIVLPFYSLQIKNKSNQISFIYPRYVFIAQVLVGPSISITETNTNIKLNITRLRIPTGRRQTSWLFYKRGLGVELGSTVKQLQLVVRARLELGTSGFQVQRPNHHFCTCTMLCRLVQ